MEKFKSILSFTLGICLTSTTFKALSFTNMEGNSQSLASLATNTSSPVSSTIVPEASDLKLSVSVATGSTVADLTTPVSLVIAENTTKPEDVTTPIFLAIAEEAAKRKVTEETVQIEATAKMRDLSTPVSIAIADETQKAEEEAAQIKAAAKMRDVSTPVSIAIADETQKAEEEAAQIESVAKTRDVNTPVSVAIAEEQMKIAYVTTPVSLAIAEEPPNKNQPSVSAPTKPAYVKKTVSPAPTRKATNVKQPTSIPEKLPNINVYPTPKEETHNLKRGSSEHTPSPKNELGLTYNSSYIRDINSHWPYFSSYYYRKTDECEFGPRVNQSHRNGGSGTQYVLEAYPILSKENYLFLSAAKASSKQILFPNDAYVTEGYFNIFPTLDLSLGTAYRKYKTFGNKKIISYSASITKTIDNYAAWIKGYSFRPGSPTLTEFGLKYAFDNDDLCYVNLHLTSGKYLDIASLPPFDQIVIVKLKGLSIDGKIPFSPDFFLTWGVGYSMQKYPTILRKVTDASLGLGCLF
ncbi:MAG TPA: YaiO family outer membrane beta-barrel protein [Gammaproteobacteria bacterium]|nr:YaiO family outer membrane beta-barrel protein [Gammaproteobacteria bacterium]